MRARNSWHWNKFFFFAFRAIYVTAHEQTKPKQYEFSINLVSINERRKLKSKYFSYETLSGISLLSFWFHTIIFMEANRKVLRLKREAMSSLLSAYLVHCSSKRSHWFRTDLSINLWLLRTLERARNIFAIRFDLLRNQNPNWRRTWSLNSFNFSLPIIDVSGCPEIFRAWQFVV